MREITKRSIKFKKILDSFRAGVLVLDRDGNILYINEIGRRILDITPEKSKASPRDPFFKVIFSSFDLEYLPSRIEIELTKKETGERKIIGFTLSDMKKGERREAIVAFFKDLSSIEKFSEAEMIKSRLVTLGQMAAGMAHEIRNPLASIKIYTEIIRKKSTGDDFDSLTKSILEDIEKVEDIVNQSLDFVKHEQVVRRPVNISSFLKNTIDSAKGIHSNIDFGVELTNIDDDETMMVDRKLFAQSLYNIFNNAAESYGGVAGKVMVSATVREEYSDILKLSGPKDLKKKLGGESKKKYLYVYVKDFGPGIKNEIREKIFTPFFTTKKKGTGIGLPISQKIIHSHDGIIDLVSKEERGTEFRIKINID